MPRPEVPGNINLYSRQRLHHPDDPAGAVSTVRSENYGDDRGEVLHPTVGRDANDPLQHLGIFRTPEAASAYGGELHRGYEEGFYDVPLASSHRDVDPQALHFALTSLMGSRQQAPSLRGLARRMGK